MPSAEEVQRVRSYLLSQANKLSVPELVDKVRRDTLPLREAAAAVPSARFFERPGPGEWSAAEVLTHVLEMNEYGAQAIEGVLDHGMPPPPTSDEISGKIHRQLRSAEDFWQTYQPRRERLFARVLRARGDEHLDVTITHRWFGPLSWREWLLFMRVHDLDHLRQLQAIARRFAG